MPRESINGWQGRDQADAEAETEIRLGKARRTAVFVVHNKITISALHVLPFAVFAISVFGVSVVDLFCAHFTGHLNSVGNSLRRLWFAPRASCMRTEKSSEILAFYPKTETNIEITMRFTGTFHSDKIYKQFENN